MAGHNLATLASNQFTPKLKADRQDTTARPREGVSALIAVDWIPQDSIPCDFVAVGPIPCC